MAILDLISRVHLPSFVNMLPKILSKINVHYFSLFVGYFLILLLVFRKFQEANTCLMLKIDSDVHNVFIQSQLNLLHSLFTIQKSIGWEVVQQHANCICWNYVLGFQLLQHENRRASTTSAAPVCSWHEIWLPWVESSDMPQPTRWIQEADSICRIVEVTSALGNKNTYITLNRFSCNFNKAASTTKITQHEMETWW